MSVLGIIAALTLCSPAQASAPAAQPPEPPVRRYALVIGVNHPAREGQKPLRFADDDAVRFHHVFQQLSGDSALFSLLDEDTQRLYPEATAEAELPQKRLILDRARQMFERMAGDEKQGVRTEFYFIYSGHGYRDDRGEGHLGLDGATFSRSELYDEILSRSTARVNHVIVDACDAYFFVQSRGGDPRIEKLLQERAQDYLDRQSLARFPNTGAILSTASAAESHEWSEIRAGVFSHEVRSALLGAADANEDARISYDELEAFVLSANAGVEHVAAERAVFVRPPERDRAHSVIDLRALVRAHRLHVPKEVGGRIAVADDRGRRYADLHKAPGYALALRLLPGTRYFARIDATEYGVPGDQHDVLLAQLEPRAPELAAKGSDIADAFERGLFAYPFGPELVRGFSLGVARTEVVAVVEEPSHPMRTGAIITGSAAVLAGGLAALMFLAGDGAAADYAGESDLMKRAELANDVAAWDTRTNVALGAAISLGVTAATLLAIDLMQGGGSKR